MCNVTVVSIWELPFHARGRDGRLLITMRANDDPYATGHDRVAKNFDAEAFKGFPVLTAEIDVPGEGVAAAALGLPQLTGDQGGSDRQSIGSRLG